MSDQKDTNEIVIDEKYIKISDAEPVKYTADINSPIAAKVKKLEEEAVRKRDLEQRRAERIRIQQDYLNGMLENVTESLAETDKEKQVNDALEQDVRRQVLSMHGISEDKYEGMQRRSAAVFQGSEFALFFMSVILIIISAFVSVTLGGPVEVTLFLCFMTAVEGTLLNHGARSKVIAWLLRMVYFLLFPMMLLVFVMDLLDLGFFPQVMTAFAVFGMTVLLLGVISYFFYNPYRADKRQLKKAGRYLKSMSKAAEKEVSRSVKEEEKEKQKEEKKQARIRKKEEKQAKKDAQKPQVTEDSGQPEKTEQNMSEKTDESAGPEKPDTETKDTDK